MAEDRGELRAERWEVVPDHSTVVVAARSSMGPISFEGRKPRGWIDLAVSQRDTDTDTDLDIDLGVPPAGEIELDVTDLRSGNDLYDAELLRRIDARRFPTTKVALTGAQRLSTDRFSLTGQITFHGQTRPLAGPVVAEFTDPDRIVITGEKVIDIRDFDLVTPTMLMLRIYPDVRVHLFLEAHRHPANGR